MANLRIVAIGNTVPMLLSLNQIEPYIIAPSCYVMPTDLNTGDKERETVRPVSDLVSIECILIFAKIQRRPSRLDHALKISLATTGKTDPMVVFIRPIACCATVRFEFSAAFKTVIFLIRHCKASRFRLCLLLAYIKEVIIILTFVK
jgi:hypothetical protein